jgi:hypothetical protein
VTALRGNVFSQVKLDTKRNQTVPHDKERDSDCSITTRPTLKDLSLGWPSLSYKFARFKDAVGMAYYKASGRALTSKLYIGMNVYNEES